MQIYFMAAVRGATQASIATTATAGQLELGPTSVPQGMFPFTPIAHEDVKPDFGFEEGKQYTLKWASAPKLNGNNVCQGDRKQAVLDASERRGSENRGFYGAGAASVLKDQVANDTPVTYYPEGSNIVLTGGATTTVKDALQTRINQDADHTSTTFTAYKDRGHSRRITTVPVTDSVNGTRIVGFARFFLLTANDYSHAQGNDPWCAIYIGPGAPEGGDSCRRQHIGFGDQSSFMELKGRRGSSILEFAIGASAFVLFFTGVFQFGYSFYVYSKLENAVRGGARYGAMSVYKVDVPTVASSPTSTFVDEVRNVDGLWPSSRGGGWTFAGSDAG